ncbi:unnamed protein product [Effrenium voratum]|nr:unnamed protein product [Effrenium voratum]
MEAIVRSLGLLRCIFNIPVCGGFCAPTKSPEESWLKHFSNEYTLPAAGVFMKLSRCLETNRCCRTCGSTGTQFGRQNRRKLLISSFWVSFVAWLLNIYAVMAMSNHPQLIKATAWSTGTLDHGNNLGGARSWVGLKSRVDEVDCGLSDYTDKCKEVFRGQANLMHEVRPGVFQRHVSFKNVKSCPENIVFIGNISINRLIASWTDGEVSAEMCEKCLKSASGTISFAIMGVITQIPQMTTDLQRATRYGDVNCQATMGCVTSFWGTFSGLSSLTSFSYSCWRSFPRIVKNENGHINFSWSMGPGFLCMLLATMLKLWDAIAHFLVPTPTIRQTKPPKECTELYDYLIRAEHYPDEDSVSESEEDISDSA